MSSREADVDRWIPNYAKLGFTTDDATRIARRCELEQKSQPEREWTEILSEVVKEFASSARSSSGPRSPSGA